MTAVALTQFRKHFSDVVHQAESEPVTITRADGKNLVLLSEADYEALAYQPYNAETRAAFLEAGRGDLPGYTSAAELMEAILAED
jgi:prevent-host-death family protein